MVARQRLGEGPEKAVEKRLQRVERAAPLGYSSVTRGRLRFIGGTLRVDSGGRVEIVGTLQIDGTTTVTGTFDVDGPWSLDGNGNITGNVTVTGDINVTGGGRIRAGQITLNPSASGGRIEIGGHTIFASGNVLSITHSGGAQVVLNDSGASLIGGGKSLSLQTAGVGFAGLPTVSSGSAGGLPSGALWVNSSNQLFRVA